MAENKSRDEVFTWYYFYDSKHPLLLLRALLFFDKVFILFCFSIRTICSQVKSPNSAPRYSESDHPVLCVRVGETLEPLETTLETSWRGWVARVGAECRKNTCSGERRGQECHRQMQRWKQSSGTDLKRQLSEVEAASLAPPGPLSSRPPSEVQN